MAWMTDSVVHVIDGDAERRAVLDELFRSVHLQVAHFVSVQEALHRIRRDARGCLIADCDAHDVDVTALPHKLRCRGIRLPIVYTSARGDVTAAVAALKVGAHDFLERPWNDQVLIDTVNDAFRADRSGWSAHQDRITLRRRFDGLTPREWDVVGPMVRGLSNRDIAERLGLSPKTVEVYRARILAKTDCGHLPELIRTAIRCRLLEELEAS